MKWKEELNIVTDRWSCTFHGESSEKLALDEVCRIVREINEEYGCRLIEPTHEHMELINAKIGNVEESESLEELVDRWNALGESDWVILKQKKVNKKTLDDIYPLTIVKRRFGGGYAIVNYECYASFVCNLQDNEDWSYGERTHEIMEKEWPYVRYGIGDSLDDALENYNEIDKRVSAWEEAARNKEYSEEEKREIEELAKTASKALSPIGFDLVDPEPMDGPKGVIYHFDFLYPKSEERDVE